MIKKITIKNTATYKCSVAEPKKINYIYGGNGTGKTTLGRFISNPENMKNGNILHDNTDFEILTYNKDFVRENFDDTSAIKGIFTIGKESKEIELEIKEKIKEKQGLEDEIAQNNLTIEKLTDEALKERERLYDECWKAQKTYERYRKCFSGFRDSKEKFAENCNKLLSNKIADTFEDIDEEYELLYKADLNIVEPFELIENIDLDKLENNEILKTSIVCIQNNSFSQLINNLKNSDWVRNGLKYLESSTLCPFCQQELSQNIKHSLLEIFDETYNYQIKMLLDLKECYDLLTSRIFSHIKNIIEKNIDFLETKNIVDLQSKLQLIVTNNKVLFEKKINTPSEIITIESIKDIVNCINKEIIIFNQKIHKNNNLAANQSRERTKLSNKSWDILVNNILYDTIKQYQNKISGINTGVFNLKNKIKLKQDKCDELQSQINTLQSKTSTIDNAINEINKALTAFAFTGFKLHKAEDGRNYKIIREDGSDVRETLSEGEQRFITFLYFYQLIQGNVEVENSTKQKIIVIDDPISSLDSNILFIVSTLVKNVISDCLSGEGLINQIFIMTHNIYFHQEVAFKSGRKNMSPNKECFWIIRKKDNISSIEISDTNLIQTSYELLWEEVRNTTKSSPASIFNTLRRILEYYFNIIGKLDYEKCINEMEGDDKILCKSLLSFINVNSHMINDDFMVISDEDTISKYIKIFEKIFEITEQKSHYDMMMQIKNED